MKLAVLCGESRLEALPQLRNALDDLFIEYKAWCSGEDFGHPDSRDSLERVLSYSSYVLCVPGPDELTSCWLHYALGYQRGHTDRLCFWIPAGRGWTLPDWTARFAVISGSTEEVHQHFSMLEKTWARDIRQVLARTTLEERNLEVSSRTLFETVQQGDRFILGLFLDAGFSPSLKDSSGVPLLNHAIRSRHIEMAGPLLEAGADLNGIAEDRGTTPLMDAAAGGIDEVTSLLIGMNAELNHASRDGQTAVTLAVGNGREKSAIALIRSGADVDQADILGMSARKYAGLYKQEKILKAIRECDGQGD